MLEICIQQLPIQISAYGKTTLKAGQI